MSRQRNMTNPNSNYLRNQIHTLAIFSEYSDQKERLKNLIETHIRMMKCCAISMENLNDMLKELIEEYGDDE